MCGATLTGMTALAPDAAERGFHESKRRRRVAPGPQQSRADRGECHASARELALVVAAKRGGAAEREELVDAFLPLVASVRAHLPRPSRSRAAAS